MDLGHNPSSCFSFGGPRFLILAEKESWWLLSPFRFELPFMNESPFRPPFVEYLFPEEKGLNASTLPWILPLILNGSLPIPVPWLEINPFENGVKFSINRWWLLAKAGHRGSLEHEDSRRICIPIIRNNKFFLLKNRIGFW